MTGMSPDDYVATLYRHVLGREPDAPGLRHWTGLLRDGADPTSVLGALLDSAEYRARAVPAVAEPSGPAFAAFADRRLRIVDVGAQLLAEGHVYDALTAAVACEIVGFDPLADRLAERRNLEGDKCLTLLPYAIGDGGTHTLHINEPDATSSLFPLNHELCDGFHHLHGLRTLRTMAVATRQLDDVLADSLPPGPVAFLKLDVQGAELMVLQGATATLARTAVVHVEVEFAPIYRGQPLYQDVAAFLTAQGFSLIDLLVAHRYAYREAEMTAPDRLLWADAVFFRDGADRDMLAAQALVARLVYRKPSLAGHLEARLEGGSVARCLPPAPAMPRSAQRPEETPT